MDGTTSPDGGGPSPGIPSEGVRAAATVAIAFVLVGLVLAVAANSVSGSSALLGTIKSRLYSPLFAAAWLDLGFDQRLTHGLPDDADHELELLRRDPSDAEPLLFPGNRWGEQAARWRRLARAIALGDAAGDGSVIAAGVGRGGFDELGVGDVVVRVFRRPLPRRDGPVDGPGDGPGDAGTAEQVYEARVRMAGDDLQLITQEAPSELAPLVKPSAPRDDAAVR